MYVLVADDTDKTYTSKYKWNPALFPYQAKGANTLFLTFLNPAKMPAVPPAMANLAQSRGTGQPGAVPSNTTIMFAIGGQAYSEKPNPWDWLTTTDKAEAMAAEVAQWPEKYGCDGIDLDIETGAGSSDEAGVHLAEFVAKVKELTPSMVITQPVFGSPSQVKAANRMLEAAYNSTYNKTALGSISKVGIMVYSDSGSEEWTKYYTEGCSAYCSKYQCSVAACVPVGDMVLGINGDAAAASITSIGNDVKSEGLGGVMVWYASLIDSATGKPGLLYGNMDASTNKLTAWATALQAMQG